MSVNKRTLTTANASTIGLTMRVTAGVATLACRLLAVNGASAEAAFLAEWHERVVENSGERQAASAMKCAAKLNTVTAAHMATSRPRRVLPLPMLHMIQPLPE